MLSEKASEEILTLSKNISLIDTNSNFVDIDYTVNFVDIDYIVNLVHNLDFEGLLYLRNVVEELINK